MNAQREIARLLAEGGGVIQRRDHPRLGASLARAARQSRLTAVLPGVYVAAGTEGDPLIKMVAVARRDPDAVFIGAAAARLCFWPEARLDRVEVTAKHHRAPQRGYAFHRRRIPPELVVERRGLRCTAPSLTALDMSDLDHTEAIDTALRTRAATLESLHLALQLTTKRPGNTDTRRLLLDSRDAPWSRAERQAHRLLRAARLTGWQTNLPFVSSGRLYYLDIAFPAVRLAVEIDGRFHEADPQVFEADRWRQNALVLDGWRVLRFTWGMLQDHPDQFVQTVRRAQRDAR